MFDTLESLTKAAIGAVKLPFDIAADVLTMRGLLSDKEDGYTSEEVKEIVANLSNATKPSK